MVDAADNDDDRRRAALENWRRVTVLWGWLGRSERDKELSDALARAAGLSSREIIDRARNGDPRAGGQFRLGTARAIVGPLLGVAYLNDNADHGIRKLEDYRGGGSQELVAYLRGLPLNVHLDLADRWVSYLRGGSADPPDPWEAAEPTLGAGPVAKEQAPTKRAPDAFESARTQVADRMPASAAPQAGSHAPRSDNTRVIGIALGGAGVVALIAAVAFLMLSRPSDLPAPDNQPPAADKKSELPPPDDSPTPTPSPTPQPAAPDRTAAEDPATPARIEIQKQRSGSLPVPIRNGGKMTSGDQFAFSAVTAEPLYVYLLAVDDGGQPSLLYPDRRDLLLQPNQAYRLPQEPDRSLELDDEIGSEHMLLLFTKGPLSRGRDELPALLREVKNRSAWPTDWPQLDAPALAAQSKTRGSTVAVVRTRGVRLAPSAGVPSAPAVTGRTNPAEVVTAHFITIDHQ